MASLLKHHCARNIGLDDDEIVDSGSEPKRNKDICSPVFGDEVRLIEKRWPSAKQGKSPEVSIVLWIGPIPSVEKA